MIVDGNICNLKAGVIEVFADPDFTILTKRKIQNAMSEMIKKDRRYNESNYSFKGMIIELL